MSAKDVNGNLN